MKIKSIDLKKVYSQYVTYHKFNVTVDDNNIIKIEFCSRISAKERVLSEVKVLYKNNKEKTYSALNVPKKYEQLFEMFLKNYKY